MSARWTAWGTVWLALLFAALAPVVVLWGMSWSSAEDAVAAALTDHLVAEAALVGERLREVPVDVLVELGEGHASQAVSKELLAMTTASGLHDAALLGPGDRVLGSGGTWLPADADADLVADARAGVPRAGPLYRGSDEALYLTAYVPLPDQPGWVVAVEGSATLGAVDRLARRQAVASVLLLVGVAGMGAGLATFVVRPLGALEREVAALQPGDPSTRVTLGGPREVRAVGSALRRLLDAVRERDAEVAAAYQDRIAQVTRLAAEIAHEIRNPLNAMSLTTERLGRVDDPPRREQLARRLQEQIDELEAIVGRLVDLTRPLEPQLGAIDVAAVVRALGDESAVAVRFSGPDPWLRWTDPRLLTEIVRNLVLNAEQAGASVVEVEVRGDGLQIRDDGSGIDDPEPLFDWFHTTRAQGSGLGLPASRRIAEALGGTLELVSPRPTTFRLKLPGGAR